MRHALSPLEALGLRWLLLEVSYDSILGSYGITERMCMDAARAAYPQLGSARLRHELAYLEGQGFLALIRSEDRPWHVKMTAKGRDLVEYIIPAPDGIARPPLSR